VLKWKSMTDPQTVAKGANDGYIGLHKVLGATVEAIVGGVYHQFVRLHFLVHLPFPPLIHLFVFSREPQKLTNSSTPISSLTSS
jgi:hypothetical protein